MNKLQSLIESGFIDKEDGTILDTRTNLLWQQSPPNKLFTWQDANKHCKSLTLAGYDDWRLPTKEELEHLINRKYYPTMDTIFDCEPDWYWSSSTDVDFLSGVWLIHFGDSFMFLDSKGNSDNFVRAVCSVKEQCV